MGERRLDVSSLEPPGPFAAALAALRELPPGDWLVLAHRREPVPLLDLLAGLGFRHRVRKGSAVPVEVVIWRAADPEPAARP